MEKKTLFCLTVPIMKENIQVWEGDYVFSILNGTLSPKVLSVLGEVQS